MRVWLVDPAAMTPYYDISLTAALQSAGAEVRLLTSRYLYEDRVPLADQYAEAFFFRGMERRAERLRRNSLLRRLARLSIYPFDLRRLWSEFNRQPPDVLHIQWTWLPLLDQPLFKRMAARVPCVLTVHDTLPRAAAMSHLADMRPLYNVADHLIVHAEENRQTLTAYAGVDPARVSVVPHGPLFTEQPVPPRHEARARLCIDPQAEVILFFGLIKPYKGLLDLIEALAQVRPRHPLVHLLVAGQPEGSTGPYLAALSEHGLHESATLRLRFIPTQEVPYYFAASDIVCLPYREASQSGVLLTAYRFGLPVVVTRVGGLPETVEEGHNGLIVPPSDPAALARALDSLLANPELRARFGAHSRKLAETRFSWRRSAALTLEIYRQVMAQRLPITAV
jgi:glycosyltransferase involved in cell wall biosynthesis